MLDNLKLIHERDAQDALGVVEKQWQQLQHKFDVSFEPKQEIRNVVLAGMGGSALPAVFLNSWPRLLVPFEIVRNYSLPAYVGPHTLVIVSSHSGNTEETLSALQEAELAKAQIVVLSAGGRLLEAAKTREYSLFQIPTGIQPRMSSFYFLAALIQLFEPLEIIPKGSIETLQAAGEWLKGKPSTWAAEVPIARNAAKQLAQELMGKSVVVYSGPLLFPAANKLKICLNENAKNVAWVNQYPELNHNEFIGWSSHPVTKPYAVVEIRSNLEHERVQRRFATTEKLLSGKRPAPHIIEPEGSTVLEQLLWSANFGDYVSIYLALLNGLNPTPVELVEKFKTALDE